jgi:L-ascorbate metabolism protein UlaG (beta-lactamase superfamily)
MEKNREEFTMKIKWYGHAAFKITTDDGVKIIIDPYESGAFGGALSYGKITDEADVVLTSHDHDDHNYTKDLNGNYTVFKAEGSYKEKGITIEAISCYHDPSKGKERGNNLIFVIDDGMLRIAHMGDLGHMLAHDTLQKMGRVDILLLPVGGFYTIDADEAGKVMQAINPKVTIPMHYKTPKCEFPIAGVDTFTEGRNGVKTTRAHEIEMKKESLPADPEIVVMQYAL